MTTETEKWIVVAGGNRVGPVFEDKDTAQAFADTQKQIMESAGNASAIVEVKQILLG